MLFKRFLFVMVLGLLKWRQEKRGVRPGIGYEKNRETGREGRKRGYEGKKKETHVDVLVVGEDRDWNYCLVA